VQNLGKVSAIFGELVPKKLSMH